VNSIAGRAGSLVIGVATALLIVAVSLPLFLNPVWVSFEQGRAEATAWTGFTESELRIASDAILADLVLGPPDFDVTLGGERHRLRTGDCLAMQLDRPTMFHNPTRKPTRYAVVIASDPPTRR